MPIGKEKRSLGESLLEGGLITLEQLNEAQAESKRTAQPLKKTILKKGFVAEDDMMVFLSKQLNIPHLDLENYIIDPKIIELIPEALARKHQLIPVLKIANSLTCAMADPSDIFAIDEIRHKTGFDIEPAIAKESDINKALDTHYGAKGSIEDIVNELDPSEFTSKGRNGLEAKRLQDISREPPVIRLVNLLILNAVKDRASDIHLEPEEETLKVRYRIDGILRDKTPPPKYLESALVSRIKVLADLDIAERRVPQDGRFRIKAENHDIDIRVSIVPTMYGENVVMRLLDTSSAITSLAELGLSPEMKEKFEKLIRRPNGIILVTGPTGSGKTTTLYAALSILNSGDKNIITVEDPVEYHLEGIRQIPVNSKVGLNFANGLRSILRQDPNIIMVGEIRDLETAQIAIHAAMTGHLVFSTLHTNDAPSAIARLIDMGVEPFLVASSVIGVLAQRLVRRACKDCGGKGCKNCVNSGYRGRVGIFELMLPNEKIRELISKKASVDEIRKSAVTSGMKTLREDGDEKAKNNLTTTEEVLRAAQTEED